MPWTTPCTVPWSMAEWGTGRDWFCSQEVFILTSTHFHWENCLKLCPAAVEKLVLYFFHNGKELFCHMKYQQAPGIHLERFLCISYEHFCNLEKCHSPDTVSCLFASATLSLIDSFKGDCIFLLN